MIYNIVLNNFPSLFYCCLGTVESLADMMVEGKILVIHPCRVGYPEKMRHDDDDDDDDDDED